jgi:osmotically-inducible protein OsmY
MDRRAFLRLSVKGRKRVLDLSCERLHMRYVDAVSAAGAPEPVENVEPALEGEPPTAMETETVTELFEDLARSLEGVDVLRVRDRQWLGNDDLRREAEACVDAFRRRGGVVEYDETAAPRRVRVSAVAILLAACLAAPVAAQAGADEALRARVEAALVAAADLPADSIAVAVQDGVVTLTGSVSCATCGGNATPGGAGTVQQSLGAVVRAVPGVTSVRFALRYRPR